MKNAINWFEIPVVDLDRAKKFYQEIFAAEFYDFKMPGFKMFGFPCDQDGVGGAICLAEGMVPSKTGVIVYLNGGDDLSIILNRVEAAGGSIVVPKTQITPEIGYFAHFIDSEGNLLALHSMN